MTEKQVKLSRLFKDGIFKGYTLSVEGVLLSNQREAVITTNARHIHPELEIKLLITNEMTDDAPDIYI
ncbi:hypothetical protein [Photorhabdus sp. CRCIA-P01]|uniref:hypothetical protein n=1 Tax=Photorhabdus sp. CRCIA-P01 TaxID=2019570 RepID=UPI000E59CDCC|nr:hypothetical protein [Photorhabdus sp. CRCIA-P01]